jgi:hypothetical protein
MLLQQRRAVGLRHNFFLGDRSLLEKIMNILAPSMVVSGMMLGALTALNLPKDRPKAAVPHKAELPDKTEAEVKAEVPDKAEVEAEVNAEVPIRTAEFATQTEETADSKLPLWMLPLKASSKSNNGLFSALVSATSNRSTTSPADTLRSQIAAQLLRTSDPELHNIGRNMTTTTTAGSWTSNGDATWVRAIPLVQSNIRMVLITESNYRGRFNDPQTQAHTLGDYTVEYVGSSPKLAHGAACVLYLPNATPPCFVPVLDPVILARHPKAKATPPPPPGTGVPGRGRGRGRAVP